MTTDVTAGAAPQVETKEETPEIPKQETADASRFAQLARREKMIRQKSREIEQERAQLLSLKQELETAKSKPDDSWISKRKEWIAADPLGALNEAGITPDTLTQLMLNQPELTQREVISLKAKIKELEDKQDQTLKKFQDNETSSYNQALKQIKNETKMLVDSSEEFETIKTWEAYDAVVDLIEHTYKTEDRLMDIETACREIEEVLIEEGIKVSKLKKIQEKINAQAVPQSEKEVQPQAKAPLTTLTHNISQQSKPISDKDRRQRAILAFQGKLS